MLLGVVKEYVGYSMQYPCRGRALQRVKELLVILRRAGFSTIFLSKLSGGRWNDGNIRTYTRGWGGEDAALSAERFELVDSLLEFARSELTVDDVKVVLRLDAAVKARRSTLPDVAELCVSLGKLGFSPGMVEVLLKLSNDLLTLNPSLTIDEVRWWIERDRELSKLGVDRLARLDLKTSFEKFGGLAGVLEAVNAYRDVTALRAEKEQLGVAVADAKASYENWNNGTNAFVILQQTLRIEIENNSKLVAELKALKELGYTIETLRWVAETTKRFGGLKTTFETMGRWSPQLDYNAMNIELSSKRAEIEKETQKLEEEKASLEKQLLEKKLYLAAIKNELSSAEIAYIEKANVRKVVHLLENPRDIEMPPSDLFNLLTDVMRAALEMKKSGVNRQFYGEPLAMGISYLEEAYRNFDAVAKSL
jgi:hypothetical protein